MPYKAKRPCGYPGCGKLTDKRYCAEHERIVNAEYERTRRSPATSKRYGKAWRVISKQYITAHPLCEMCLRNGFAVPAVHVHHRIPLADGGTNDEGNLIALCKACHSAIHLELRRGVGGG